MADARVDEEARLPLLERSRQLSGLSDPEARRLVAYAAVTSSEWWAIKALDWAEQGVTGDEITDAFSTRLRDGGCSQSTHDRIYAFVKSQGYWSDPMWRTRVASTKWTIRVWTFAFTFGVVAVALSDRAGEIVLGASLAVGLPIFSVTFGISVWTLWRHYYGHLPGIDDYMHWHNSASAAAWREARGRSARSSRGAGYGQES